MKYKIDWEKQWMLHSPFFQNGLAQIPLEGITNKLFLKPGPGFGDFSHPTTRLVFKNMSKYVFQKKVLDVGCGTGILSLAAYAYGASKVSGIDIDLPSIEHAKENALLNRMSEVNFSHVDEYVLFKQSPEFILMNMIRSEQKKAWDSVKEICKPPFFLLTSGILEQEKEAYIHECKERNWQIKQEYCEEGWLAFLFEMNRL